MPIFYFEITDDGRTSSPTALNLPNKKAAWKEATVTAGQMLRDLDGDLQPGTEWRIEVAAVRENRFEFALHYERIRIRRFVSGRAGTLLNRQRYCCDIEKQEEKTAVLLPLNTTQNFIRHQNYSDRVMDLYLELLTGSVLVFGVPIQIWMLFVSVIFIGWIFVLVLMNKFK